MAGDLIGRSQNSHLLIHDLQSESICLNLKNLEDIFSIKKIIQIFKKHFQLFDSVVSKLFAIVHVPTQLT